MDLRGWRYVCNAEVRNLRSSANIIRSIGSRKMRWVGHVGCMGEMTGSYKIVVRRPQEKRRRQKDAVQVDIKREWECMD